jgi:hypothetical protein
MALFEPIFEALERAGARYVVVGGFATVLHGVARLTADVDLIVDLEPAEAEKVIVALTGLGFRPRPPVEARQFADPAIRASWIRDKGMRVFSLWDPGNPMREVDLFVEHPLDFERLWQNAEHVDLGAVRVRVASVDDLIALKRLAGRPQDVSDVAELEAIATARGRGRD